MNYVSSSTFSNMNLLKILDKNNVDNLIHVLGIRANPLNYYIYVCMITKVRNPLIIITQAIKGNSGHVQCV